MEPPTGHRSITTTGQQARAVRPGAPPAVAATLGVLVLLLTLLVPAAPASATAHRDAELEFIRLVNAERSSRGLATLTERWDLRDVAYAWSTEMAGSGTLAHNPDFSDQICCWLRVSENVAYSVGRSDWKQAVEVLHGRLMDSSSHRHNILQADVRDVGVGVWFDGNAMWVTQNFRQPDGTTPPTGSTPPGSTTEQQETRTVAEVDVRGTALACTSELLALVRYLDVASDSVASSAISCVSAWEIASGVGDGRYAPDGVVTRGQMATFLARTVRAADGDLSATTSVSFTDTKRHPHEGSVDELAAAGLVSGCDERRFCPDEPVTRAQMATFIAKAWVAIDGSALPEGPEHFLDDDASPHEASIDAIAAAGLAGGISHGTYAPGRSVTRAQMAMFLARLLDLAVEEGHAQPPTL